MERNHEPEDERKRSRWLLLLLLLLFIVLGGGAFLLPSDRSNDPPQMQEAMDGAETPDATANVVVRARASEDGEVLTDFNIAWTVYALSDEGARIYVGTWPLATGRFVLAPGSYIVQGRRGNATAETLIDVPENGMIEEYLTIGAGRVAISAVLAPGGDAIANPNMVWEAYQISQDGTRNLVVTHPFAGGTLTLDSGPHVLRVRWGGITFESEVEVVADQTLSHVAVLNAGLLNLSAREPDGSAANNFTTSLRINRIDPDDKRTPIAEQPFASASIPVPAGVHYVEARGSNGRIAEATVELTAGETVTLALTFDR